VLLCAGSIGVFSLYRRQMLFIQHKSRVSTLEHVVLTETVIGGVVLYPGLFCIKKILQGSEFTLESDFAESRRFVQTDVKSEKVSIDKN
jgi:hypothetical protein